MPLARQPIQDGLANQGGAGEAAFLGGGEELRVHRDEHARGLLACGLGRTTALIGVRPRVGDALGTRAGELDIVLIRLGIELCARHPTELAGKPRGQRFVLHHRLLRRRRSFGLSERA
jgi:hypothetical protein